MILIKAFKFFVQKLFFTTRLKFWMTEWIIAKKYIKNWFVWYSLCTSYFIHLAQRVIFMHFKNNLTFKAKYKNGLSIIFPLKHYLNNWDVLWKLPFYKYMNAFKRHYNTNIALNKNDVIIDIGAHHGGFSAPLLYHNNCVKLITIEPDRENFGVMKKNLENLNSNNIELFLINAAISDKEGEVEFIPGDISTRGYISSVNFKSNATSKKNINTVKAFSIDRLFKDYSIKKCKILKIDCEGAEYEIIYKMNVELLQKVENIFLEIHPVCGKSKIDLINYIKKNGFLVKYDKFQNGCLELYAIKNTSNESYLS